MAKAMASGVSEGGGGGEADWAMMMLARWMASRGRW
jgi:hypothetical protein